MFNFDKQDATLTNVNWRTERHGEEKVRAVDLKFVTKSSNTILDAFAKGLKESFFRKPSKGEQPDIPGIGVNQLTQVLHPFLGTQKLPHEFEGYELQIESQLDTDSAPIFLTDVKLKKFEVSFFEGGVVELEFTASASHIESDDLVELDHAQLREGNRITLTPPAQQKDEQKAA